MLDFCSYCLWFAFIFQGDTMKIPITSENQKNPRFSTTSSTDGGEEILDQLVVAEVHHEPILEIKETGTIKKFE